MSFMYELFKKILLKNFLIKLQRPKNGRQGVQFFYVYWVQCWSKKSQHGDQWLNANFYKINHIETKVTIVLQISLQP